jgi:hypothetical protein
MRTPTSFARLLALSLVFTIGGAAIARAEDDDVAAARKKAKKKGKDDGAARKDRGRPAKDPKEKKKPLKDVDPEIDMTPDATPSPTPAAVPGAIVEAPIIDPLAPPEDGSLARWPREIVARPRTLPKDAFAGLADLDIQHSSVTVNGAAEGLTTIGLRLGGSYGITDALELGLAYELYPHTPDRGVVFPGPLDLRAAYRVYAQGKLSAAAQVRIDHDFDRKTSDVYAGAYVHYRVTPALAIYSPGEQLVAAVQRADRGTVAAIKPASFHLPVGLGYQLDGKLYLYGEIELAKLNINADANAFLFADYVPLRLGGFYSVSHQLDVGLAFEFPDLKDLAGGYAVLLRARAYKF